MADFSTSPDMAVQTQYFRVPQPETFHLPRTFPSGIHSFSARTNPSPYPNSKATRSTMSLMLSLVLNTSDTWCDIHRSSLIKNQTRQHEVNYWSMHFPINRHLTLRWSWWLPQFIAHNNDYGARMISRHVLPATHPYINQPENTKEVSNSLSNYLLANRKILT